jgi:hypothetical protein
MSPSSLKTVRLLELCKGEGAACFIEIPPLTCSANQVAKFVRRWLSYPWEKGLGTAALALDDREVHNGPAATATHEVNGVGLEDFVVVGIGNSAFRTLDRQR